MTVFDILISGAILAVSITLGFGLKALFTGEEAARSRSNRLMRLRVALQAVAIALLAASMWWKSTYGG